MTDTQATVLRFIARDGQLSAKQIARRLWPDSDGWKRRSRRGSGGGNGALGATMPMRAGRVLRAMEKAGLVYQTVYGAWAVEQKRKTALRRLRPKAEGR